MFKAQAITGQHSIPKYMSAMAINTIIIILALTVLCLLRMWM